ncbi:MAG: substrate-binding and VWA domain-containing protein [Chloroflexota bacterium]|nr:substrate-binding and VWA domain-containing protein [Chloroflexota bacterium]
MNGGRCTVVHNIPGTCPMGGLPHSGFPICRQRLPHVVLALLLLLGLAACIPGTDSDSRLRFRLVTGTENRSLSPMIERFAEQENVRIELTHQGSVDTMLELQKGAAAYDAVWPASSIWLSLGDTGRLVTQTKSIMATPVVFAVKRPVAERLGWVDRDVTVEEILAAAEAGQLRYMTTSATQSNSGAMAYLGYVYAFARQPEVLTSAMLHEPAVVERTKRILSLVDRSAGASGFLRDLFLQQYDAFDGMVNNESAVIAANQQLSAEGRDPLYVVYPVDGLAIADWPLGYVDRGDVAKAEFFAKLQDYLLSPDVQKELLAQGRRTGLGLNPIGADPKVFNPDWGIDLDRVIQPITLPPPDVIREALVLYQTALRKPSFTVFCLDFSGSMEGQGVKDLKSAMGILLQPDQAARYFLQPSTGDVTIVIPFDDETINQWRVDGNDPAALRDLLGRVIVQAPGGGTNIYAPVIAALDAMEGVNMEDYSPAIILMTDGRSNHGDFAGLQTRLGQGSPGRVPVYAILFGDASKDQLIEITEATAGRIFDGRTDLIGAMREAKGYN